MQNFSDAKNGFTDGTHDINCNNVTVAGTSTLNGSVVLGNSATPTVTWNASLASSIPVSANTTWDFGSSTLGLKSVYIGGTSSFTTRLMSAATSTWTLTLPATAGSSGQLLSTDGSGNSSWASVKGNATILGVPTVQTFTATGTTTGYLFTISTATTCAVGDTYSNNSNTYTVLGALSGQGGQVLFTSGASAPLSSGTLTRTAGAGTTSITFSASTPLATYTAPVNAPLYLKVRAVGGGGGGGGVGTTGALGTSGNPTFFGANIITLLGGLGGGGAASTVNPGGGGGGQNATVNTSASVIQLCSFAGSGGGPGCTSSSNVSSGGAGGSSPFGGGARGSANNTPGAAGAANSGSGGSGAGCGAGSGDGGAGGGGSGAYAEVLFTGITSGQLIPYIVGTGGGGGAGQIQAGGAGAAGLIICEECNQ